MNSNFKGDLYLEHSDEIELRMLKNEDIPALIQLGGDCFFYLNQACSLMVSHLDDTINFMSCTDYEKIISQQMAFGAFKDGKLISFAIGCDYAINVSNKNVIPTTGAKNMFQTMGILSAEYGKITYKTGECFFLYLLATDRTCVQKNVATKCFYESCKAAQQRGFKKFIIQAWHPATKKITEKMFKEVKIEASISEYKGQQTSLWAISALF